MVEDTPVRDDKQPRADADTRHRRLNPKQRRFVQEYLIDLNAAGAARRSGYREKSAPSHGPRLLRNPEVAAAIDTALAERSERTRVTADNVVRELAKVAFGDPRRLLSWGPDGLVLRKSSDLTEAEAALVSEITETGTGERATRRVKLHCKMTALTALARHLGLFNGRLKRPEHVDNAGANEGESARERLARKIARIAASLETDESPGESDGG